MLGKLIASAGLVTLTTAGAFIEVLVETKRAGRLVGGSGGGGNDG